MRNDIDSDVAVLPKSNSIFYTAGDPREAQTTDQQFTDLKYLEETRRDKFLLFGEDRILPNGFDNNFPSNYKNLLDQVYIGHGVKRSLINLLLSGGVSIYKEIKEANAVIKDWQLLSDFPEVEEWLESFNFFTEYLPEAATDMIYVENTTTLFSRNRGARIGISPKIAALRHIGAEEARLDYAEFNQAHKFIYQSDWTYNTLRLQNMIKYPIWDRTAPFAAPHAAVFIKMPTFASFAYGRPTDIGATEMLKLLAILPQFHRANLTEKPLRWLIKVNSAYYDGVCAKNNWTKSSKEFADWKQEFKSSIDSFLYAAKGDKVQTRLFTEFVKNSMNQQMEENLTIEKLDDNTKELSETGLNLWDSATVGFVSANSVHPQLANINLKNHALSGSNLVEAYNMHILTATPTMRNLLLAPANTALKVNWPGLGLKLGFMDSFLTNKHTESNATQQSK